MLVIVALVMPVLLGAAALGTDVAVFYFNWAQLQKAADSAVLAGANFLPDDPSQANTAATQFAESNGVQSSEIVSTTFGVNDLSITMKVQRTLPFFFARALGLKSGAVVVTATGAPQNPPHDSERECPWSGSPGGDDNGANGTTCANIGSCDLIPIGLDSHTVYNDGEQITLQQGEIGPGNWDLLALGGVGGNNLRTNIANGYNAMVSVGDWVTTEPGKKVGPVDQGFQDRLNQAPPRAALSRRTAWPIRES